MFLAFFRNTLATFVCHSAPERLKDRFAQVPIAHRPQAVLAQRRDTPLSEQRFQLRWPIESVGGDVDCGGLVAVHLFGLFVGR